MQSTGEENEIFGKLPDLLITWLIQEEKGLVILN